MEITLYRWNYDVNTIVPLSGNGKDLGSCYLKDATSIIHPEIYVEYDDNEDHIPDYNYLRISQFHRFYFIRDIISVRAGLWLIKADVDPLNSFDSQIKKLEVLLDDSEDDGNNYLTGEQWKSTVKTKTDILNFSNGFNDSG